MQELTGKLGHLVLGLSSKLRSAEPAVCSPCTGLALTESPGWKNWSGMLVGSCLRSSRLRVGGVGPLSFRKASHWHEILRCECRAGFLSSEYDAWSLMFDFVFGCFQFLGQVGEIRTTS